MMDPYSIALDLKDRYVRFLDRQGRLSYRGDVNEFKHILNPESTVIIGEELGKGSYARVRAVDLTEPSGNRQQLVQRIYENPETERYATELAVTRRIAAGIDDTPTQEGHSLRQALVSLPREMHGPILRRIEQERETRRANAQARLAEIELAYSAAIDMTGGQFGRILGISLDAELEDAIEPIIGFGFERIAPDGRDAFTLYQPRADTTLGPALRNALVALGNGSPTAAVTIADLVDAACALVGRTDAAGYIDADFKGENIGITRKPCGRGYVARTVDIGELRPTGALRSAFERHIARNPEDAGFLPTYMTGSLRYVPARKVDAFATRHPTELQVATIAGDDRTALALTLASDLFDLYASLRDPNARCAPIETIVLRARCAFLDPKAKQTTPPALAPYRACIERAIAADLSNGEYATGAFLQDLRTASGDVRAYARRTQ